MTHTKTITRIGLGMAVLCVSGLIAIPIAGIPITLQTLVICTVSAVLGKRQGVLCVAGYLLLGAIGLPVFSGGRGGFGILMGATGGYLIGFVLLAFFAGFGRWQYMVIGTITCYAFGTVWFAVLYGGSVGSILMTCVVPFLLPDGIKIAASRFISQRIRHILQPSAQRIKG